MKVGDLIRWDDSYGTIIYGLVLEIKQIENQSFELIHAWVEWAGNADKDGYYPVNYWAFEVINENR
tara:strand:+ start:281 stop:478 length:198 start_codon:yes stop_codon:yes gene_type:complete